MSMVINTNIQATRTHNVYNKNNSYMNEALTRVATGQKINSAKDNASQWAISEKMRERIRANDQANQNVQNDTALLKTAQDGLGNTLDILKTLKERAINSANDSNVNSDRTKIVEEVRQLVQQIDDNANKVKFNGRALLNGAVDPGAVSSSSSGSNSVGTVAATAVTATDPQGSAAVYSITNLKAWDDTNKVYADATTATKLVDLVDASGNGDSLFQAGDKITFAWKDNGEDKSVSYSVTSASKLTDLVSAITAGDGATSFDSTDTGLKAADTALSNVKKSDGTTAFKTTDAGIYISGNTARKITDLAISVTTSSGATRTVAQEAMQANALQQTYGDGSKGSNIVYSVTGIGGDDGDKTAWMNLTKSSSAFYKTTDGTVTEGTSFTITVNGKQATFTGGTTIEELNQKFEQSGINIRAHITTEANQELSYDGNTVMKGNSDSTVSYKAATAGLYFVGANGENINSIKITGGTTTTAADGAKLDTTANDGSSPPTSTSLFVKDLDLNKEVASSSDSSATPQSLLPQGPALQFYVGGESNFGVNFAIGKATVQTLLGTTTDSFANKFATKNGAESAISVIDTAINKTLTEQTRLGAMEARLGYTSDNLTSMNTNLEAADSAYRDSDIAKDMTQYMKYAVLSQASQYMLSQTSQNAFSVLNLLQA